MRTLKILFIACFILAVSISCGNSTGPGESVSDYVELSASGNDPAFIFLKESGDNVTYEYSNIEYNIYGNKVSFNLLITFNNGHTYDIYCSNIERFEHYHVTGYRAEITVRWGSKTISGTLFYGDGVFIKSVDPSTGLVPNIATNFKVVVEYQLISLDAATIDVCFNDGDSVKYFYSRATKIITKGTGEHTFNVTVTPKDWGEEGDFEVWVILSDEYHEILSIDKKVLLFE